MLQLVTCRWHIIHHDVSMSDMSKTSVNHSVVDPTLNSVYVFYEWNGLQNHIPFTVPMYGTYVKPFVKTSPSSAALNLIYSKFRLELIFVASMMLRSEFWQHVYIVVTTKYGYIGRNQSLIGNCCCYSEKLVTFMTVSHQKE